MFEKLISSFLGKNNQFSYKTYQLFDGRDADRNAKNKYILELVTKLKGTGSMDNKKKKETKIHKWLSYGMLLRIPLLELVN